MTNPRNISEFKKQLEGIINSNNMEGTSNTPDFILAKYLYNCLQSYEIAVQDRDKWYGIQPVPGDSHQRQ